MSVAFNNWRNQTDETLKYKMYLCSPEWGRLKQQVRQRAKGKCERCGVRDMDAVHHLHYANKYNEKLEDLRAICNDCHEIEHGLKEEEPIRIYMAGKMDAQEYRPRGSWINEANPALPWSHYEFEFSESGKRFVYTGPFSILHEHGCNYFGDDLGHSYEPGSVPGAASRSWDKGRMPLFIRDQCFSAISSSDVVFAWVSSTWSLGTHVEIGFAYSIGKPILLGMENYDRHQWFIISCATAWMTGGETGEATFASFVRQAPHLFRKAYISK